MEQKRVLVVEDEALVAMDLKYTLERLGYEVVGTATTGKEAVGLAGERNPDVVLMDIVLPGDMDGIEAAAEIRDQFDIPVVYVTAYADESKIQRAKATEPFGYIMKPFQERELHGNIQVALYRHDMERSLRQSKAVLEQVMRGTLNAMAKMVELKDPIIAGHQHRVARLSAAIAKEIGLFEEDAEGIRLAATVHAAGLLGIPYSILSKQRPLSEHEVQLFRTHARIGYDLFKDIGFPWPVADVALHHHERMDGSGYPDGLKGEEISIAARIVAVASTVDFITFGGTHAFVPPELRGQEAALDEISHNAGTLYDPNVVEACVRLIRDKGFNLAE
jgi:putative two-component system response regulator